MMIHKKGAPNDISDFRHVTLLNHSPNSIIRAVCNSPRPLIRDARDLTPMGFLPRIETRDAFYTIHHAIAEMMKKMKVFSILFVDFRNTFDT